jgi:RNA polymerase sigma factor (sigma-70 family)
MIRPADIKSDLIAIYVDQWRQLCVSLTKRTGSRELAEDALQETWMRLSSMREMDEPVRDRKALILKIAANIATDIIRRERRHSSRCINDEAVLLAIEDAYPSPEIFAIDRDQLRQLVVALTQLPEKALSALLMSRCDALTHRQIAEKLAVSESMVAKYLAQAVRHCRDYFRALD